jgi:hypothetical protein
MSKRERVDLVEIVTPFRLHLDDAPRDEASLRLERLEAVRYLVERHGAKVIATIVKNVAAERGETV